MTYKTILLRMLLGTLLLPLLACSDDNLSSQTAASDKNMVRWRLPSSLVEVSGLAIAGPDELFAVDDESAWIYRINIATGNSTGRTAIGKPRLKGDFEGIATHAGVLYLVTSDGLLYAAELIAGQPSLNYEQFDLGLRKACEIEGLSEEINGPNLWLICKQSYDDADGLQMYAWSTQTQQLVPELHRRLPHPTATDKQGRFNPSALAFAADGQSLLVIAARQKAFAWYSWTDTPELLRADSLPNAKKHRQAEGLAIMPDGKLLIADEGKEKSGVIARYKSAF